MQPTQDALVLLAQKTIRSYVTDGTVPAVPNLPEDLPQRAGTFVTISEKNGDLRGCIGTIAPTQPTLAEEVIHNAISAATRDPRFYAVGEEELDDLIVSVDVLGEPEPTTFEMLDPDRYGVIVTLGLKRGLLLPDIDGVDTPQKQVEIALKKAGISPFDKYELERFEVVRHV